VGAPAKRHRASRPDLEMLVGTTAVDQIDRRGGKAQLRFCVTYSDANKHLNTKRVVYHKIFKYESNLRNSISKDFFI